MPKVVTKQFADPSIVETQGVLIQSEFLTNIIVGMRANQFKLNNILPEEPVRKDTDKIQVISPKGFFKTAPKRAETALPEQSAVQFDEDTYTTNEYALEGWVSEDSIRNAIDQLKPLARQADYLAKRIALTQEIAQMQEILTAIKAAGANYYNILNDTYKWYGGSAPVPLTDISNAIKKIVSRTGYRPNIASMSTDSYEAFANSSHILEILKYTSAKSVEAALPVDTIRGLQLQIADAIANAGTLASPTYKNIQYDVSSATQLFDTVIVAFVDENDPLTFGRTFISKQPIAFTAQGLEGSRRQAILVYIAKKLGAKVLNVGAGYLIARTLGG